ncbi:ParA family protein [Streptomyces sp. NPDC050564]|uniref:ParA family protein n=1 Tax=Streptomyces sp. NPDC050564 TaxID=3365631 RepID=UPI0037A032FB
MVSSSQARHTDDEQDGFGHMHFLDRFHICLYALGCEACVIGMDKQRDVSRLLGYDDPDGDEDLPTLYYVVDKLVTLAEAVAPARDSRTKEPIPNLWVVLESKKLDTLEFKLAGETARELWLYRMIAELRGHFDVIIIDCPGDVKFAAIGAIIAGDEVVGCTKSQEKEARGLTELEDKIAEVADVYGHTGMPTGIDWVVIGEGVKNKPPRQGLHRHGRPTPVGVRRHRLGDSPRRCAGTRGLHGGSARDSLQLEDSGRRGLREDRPTDEALPMRALRRKDLIDYPRSPLVLGSPLYGVKRVSSRS